MSESTASADRARPEVLVVGAGPVGLMAALRLSLHGVSVRVVDQHPEADAHSFPVVLHPQSLRLLTDVGLSEPLLWQGRQVTQLAVYADFERRAVLEFPSQAKARPGLLTLPQDTLRRALLGALASRGVDVEWNTRLAVLQQDDSAVWGRLVQEDAKGLLSGRNFVEAFEAQFVIGADGYESTTRATLGIELIDHGGLQTFAFFDAPTQRGGHEAQLALEGELVSSVYPVQGGCARFSFQLGRGLDKALDHASLRELVSARMPWFGEEPGPCEWSGVAEFRRALATRFGVGRVWLAGEAAHLTAPLGVQSLNIGLDEASELGDRMAEALGNPKRPSFGPHYDAKRSRQWRALLGLDRVEPSTRSPDWARKHAPRLLACLPASGAELLDLLDQLRLTPVSEPPAGDD